MVVIESIKVQLWFGVSGKWVDVAKNIDVAEAARIETKCKANNIQCRVIRSVTTEEEIDAAKLLEGDNRAAGACTS